MQPLQQEQCMGLDVHPCENFSQFPPTICIFNTPHTWNSLLFSVSHIYLVLPVLLCLPNVLLPQPLHVCSCIGIRPDGLVQVALSSLCGAVPMHHSKIRNGSLMCAGPLSSRVCSGNRNMCLQLIRKIAAGQDHVVL